MDKEVVITAGFSKQLNKVYQYLLKEWSARVAFEFVEGAWARIKFIEQNQELGKPSTKRKGFRSIPFHPHNRIYFRVTKTKIFIVSLFDMRQHPSKNHYQ